MLGMRIGRPGRASLRTAIPMLSAAMLLGACAHGSSDLTNAAAWSQCAASSLVVTGQMGERLHPRFLPPGFVPETLYKETETSQGMLTYIAAPSDDTPWIEIGKNSTSLAPAELLDELRNETVTIHGHPAATAGTPGATFDIAWEEAEGIVVYVIGHRLTAAQVIAIAQGVEYTPGSRFTYPIRPKVVLSRAQAIAKLPGNSSHVNAVLSSFGEVDAVLSPTRQGVFNREPVLDPTVEVGRAVWMVWDGGGRGLVVDATTGAVLATPDAIHQTAAARLTDRSKPGCAPPFGVLTRSEISFLTSPPRGATTSTIKLTTMRTLLGVSETADLGNCQLHECDPAVPVWLMINSAPDCSLAMRCGPLPGHSTSPSSPPGTWSIRPFDARTGAQTGFATQNGGRGPVPSDLIDLPDLEPK
jgi:hypothetical protein